MGTYLVTGCAGFVGSHLTEALLERGHTVRGIDSFTDVYLHDNVLDFTYVSDAVEATILAMTDGPAGATYNVGGGNEATLADVVRTVEEITGREVRLDRRPAASGDVLRTTADTTRLRGELGWQPAVDLENGLRNQLAWLEASYATT